MTRLAVALLFVSASISAAVPLDAGATAAAAEPEKRIVGGMQTSIAKYPYQVSVRLDSSALIHICGGSIYASRVIVTAAHCLKGRYASHIRVVAGSSTIADQSEQGVAAKKLIYHSGYSKKTHENDVGLIILAADLVWSDVVQPIPLAPEDPAAGTHATVTGWGKSDEEAKTLTNMLQEVDVKIVDTNVCHAQYTAKDYSITEQMVCAGVEAGGKDTCQGDSGGPMVTSGKLVGIVSWGIGCARSDFPGVYASVPYHADWITAQAQPYL